MVVPSQPIWWRLHPSRRPSGRGGSIKSSLYTINNKVGALLRTPTSCLLLLLLDNTAPAAVVDHLDVNLALRIDLGGAFLVVDSYAVGIDTILK